MCCSSIYWQQSVALKKGIRSD